MQISEPEDIIASWPEAVVISLPNELEAAGVPAATAELMTAVRAGWPVVLVDLTGLPSSILHGKDVHIWYAVGHSGDGGWQKHDAWTLFEGAPGGWGRDRSARKCHFQHGRQRFSVDREAGGPEIWSRRGEFGSCGDQLRRRRLLPAGWWTGHDGCGLCGPGDAGPADRQCADEAAHPLGRASLR
jgi:hypothetical protein